MINTEMTPCKLITFASNSQAGWLSVEQENLKWLANIWHWIDQSAIQSSRGIELWETKCQISEAYHNQRKIWQNIIKQEDDH